MTNYTGVVNNNLIFKVYNIHTNQLRRGIMKYYILQNPLAANGTNVAKAHALADTLNGECELIDITSIDSYADFFTRVNDDDTIVICGGDGTINRFVNDTVGIEIKNDILYYPIGTGNDFLRDVEKDGSAPFSIKEYIKDLPSVEVNGKTYRFINNVGFGIDGYCCETGDALKAKSDKPINYTSIAIKGLLFHFKPANATVCVDGKEYSYKKVWIAPTMKGRFYGGGMMPAPKQDRSAENGEVSIMVFHGTSSLQTLIIFPSLFKGEHVKHTKHVVVHTGHEISVVFDKPCALQIDGETISGVTSYKVNTKVLAKV
jgi:diacylglycerol kinase family enzyme